MTTADQHITQLLSAENLALKERLELAESCYADLVEAIETHLADYIFDDDVAAVAIYCDAIQRAGVALKRIVPTVLYHVFYNHDDDLNAESMIGPYFSVDSAKEAAQQEHDEYLSFCGVSDASPLAWEIDNDYKDVVWYAPCDKHHERYFRIEPREMQL